MVLNDHLDIHITSKCGTFRVTISPQAPFMPFMIFQEKKLSLGPFHSPHTWTPCQPWYLCGEIPRFTLRLWILEQLAVPGSLQAVVK